jgi:uncharacterized repeat protein (TIGR01451 family)
MSYYLIIISFLLLAIWGLWQHLNWHGSQSSTSYWGAIAASTSFLTIGLSHLTSPLIGLIFASLASCAIGFINLWGIRLQMPQTKKQQQIWSLVSFLSILMTIAIWQCSGWPELVKLGLTVVFSSIAVIGLMTAWIRLRTWVITGIVIFSTIASFQIQGTFTPAAFAANQTFASGAYIVDLGQATQTINNGLKPYGLVYDLVINKGIPVIWAINPSKVKDGVDFTANGKSYSGSAFIIAPEYAPAVAATITTWRGLGVVVDGPLTTSFTAPIFDTITSFPNSILDLQNGSIAKPYYTNAGIPATSSASGVFGTFTTYRDGAPISLSGCDDILVLPHADPTWASHQYLIPFNQGKGFIWAGCHAVSVLENIHDPSLPGTAPTMNFLSGTDGLVPFGHAGGSPPYTYTPGLGSSSPYQWFAVDAVDPIMQFIGTLDAATQNGSEQIYLPNAAGWRATTKISVYDPTQANVPSLSPGPATTVAYGRGFGNPSNGMVLYEAGHNLNQVGSAAVAAQRAFFNFVLLAGIDRRVPMTSNIPSPIIGGTTVNVSATGGTTYKWVSNCGGSFANANTGTTTFTAPAVGADTSCNLRVAIEDPCGRRNFGSSFSLIKPPPISISGTVWHDKNNSAAGTFINIKTGAETGTNAVFGTTTIPVHSILVDTNTGLVVRTQLVAANGSYNFPSIETNTNVKIILAPTAGTVGSVPPTAAIPTGWLATSPTDTGIFNSGYAALVRDFGIRQKAKFAIVKRITKINGQTINPNDSTDLSVVTLDTFNNVANWPANYLIGKTDAGKVKPNDQIEYTVYFLNNQGADAIAVKICDPIRGTQEYVPNSIKLNLAGATSDTSLTDAVDNADRANSYAVGAAPIDCNITATTANGVDNGGVAVGITGTGKTVQPNLISVPGATAVGQPTAAYGLFRFITKVKP